MRFLRTRLSHIILTSFSTKHLRAPSKRAARSICHVCHVVNPALAKLVVSVERMLHTMSDGLKLAENGEKTHLHKNSRKSGSG